MQSLYRWRHRYAISRLYDWCWWEGRDRSPRWITSKRMTWAKYQRLAAAQRAVA